MLLIKNAKIYTQNRNLPVANALLINDGKVVACGLIENITSELKSKPKIVDLKGKTVIPGLTDSHLHLYYLGKSLTAIDCETNTLAECLERIQQRVSETPVGEWVVGHGWNQNIWDEGFGTRQHLDSISTQHPIFLTAKSLHAAWANSKALQMAGINADDPDPEGGSYGRFPDGKLNGILFEGAYLRVESIIPPLEGNQLVNVLQNTQEHLWKLGITAVHDFDGADCFRALQIMDNRGTLRLRVLKSIPARNLDAVIQSGLQSGFGSDFLRIGSLKLFADGALGPQTAAMLAPYEGQGDNSGALLMEEEEIFEYGKKATSNGLSLAIHAIGDRANRVVLDAFQKIRGFEKQEGLPFQNHRIEHVQLLHPHDVERLSKLKIIASAQPIHLISDMHTADRYWGERASLAYAFNSLAIKNTALIFGSDAPVESANPFIGFYAAVTRRNLEGEPGESGWYPNEKMTLSSVLDAYTTTPAEISGFKIGSLEPGYMADLVLLNEDPFEIDQDEIRNIKPEATMVAGDWVWEGTGD